MIYQKIIKKCNVDRKTGRVVVCVHGDTELTYCDVCLFTDHTNENNRTGE